MTTTPNYKEFSERKLLNILSNARNKISTLSSEIKALDKRRNAWLLKELEIKQALANKYMPNDETIQAMRECEQISQDDDIVKSDNVAGYLKGLVNNG